MVQTNVSIGHMTHSFQNYPVGNKPRSGFNRSNELLTAFNGGYLVPIRCRLAYPGDTVDMSIATFTRMIDMIVPFMTPIYMDVHVWSVPLRLLWEHWVNFNGEQKNPTDSIDYLTPQLTTTSTSDIAFGSLYDYLGVRPAISGISFNSFRFRAYNLIYNEWYRDENLQNSVPFTTADSGDTLSDYVLLKRGKRKDYFTGALPWTQKGTSVNLPIGLSAPVFGVENEPLQLANFTATGAAGVLNLYGGSSALNTWSTATSRSDAMNVVSSGTSNLYADLSQATGVTLNQLYDSIAIQTVLQNDAIGGTRYIESILKHFGVKSSDARLQRPEFLGGGTFKMDMNVVPQTSSSDSTSPQGNLVANGAFAGVTKRIIKSFEEHSIIMAIASVRVPYYYQYGMDRDFFRHSRFDFYLPELANITEQAILNQEIFVDGSANDTDVFGYQEAWADMRYEQNRITGLMRSDAPQSLDIWHLAEKRTTAPALNDEWIQESSTIYNRVLAVQSTEESPTIPQFIGNFAFDEKWYRVMPVYSRPGIQRIGGL